MEHVVFFPSPDGAPAFRRVTNLEEAVRLVEHLRNVEGVGEASVHALTEVPLSFRAYYRVEVPGLSDVVPAVEDVRVAVPAQDLGPFEPAHLEPVPDLPVEEHAVHGESARSLGFFA